MYPRVADRLPRTWREDAKRREGATVGAGFKPAPTNEDSTRRRREGYRSSSPQRRPRRGRRPRLFVPTSMNPMPTTTRPLNLRHCEARRGFSIAVRRGMDEKVAGTSCVSVVWSGQGPAPAYGRRPVVARAVPRGRRMRPPALRNRRMDCPASLCASQ
jgi:hypothetical protein